MPVHLIDPINQGRRVPGIFILNPSLSIGQNIDELMLIVEGSFAREDENQIIHLSLTRRGEIYI
ncbi:MAG: hypothetical protein HC769_37575 [Cyanobacteria bacterium CRU_2_1]|nr:hypothetical protein [Cyanobacteria bacterium RU_5_0]NJR63969.1 hypothetical protein [Cyanobacteria bacterium CRU_2_1]